MKSKWFTLGREGFKNKGTVRTLNSAWDKTLEKWILKMMGVKEKSMAIDTCGLCNVYNSGMDGCGKCPVKEMSGRNHCIDTPFEDYDKGRGMSKKRAAGLEYLFLLFVKEATE